ncbi:MAG: T9SS type A sorting domain-containing protein [Bacteroidetes bacterium]|nr:T9SS type A sorting domain-containing protein [Bacteroidota bacterium]
MRTAFQIFTLILLMTFNAVSQPGWFQVRSEGDPLLFSIDLFDADHITAVGSNGLILQSDNGGASWRTVSSAASENLRRVRWFSPSLGILLGNGGMALKSTDGGATWQQLTTGTSVVLFDVHFFDENNWLVIGQAAFEMTTTDGGATWDYQGSGTNNFNEIAFKGDLGIIVGNKGTIRTTEDGGSHWRDRSGATDFELTSISIGDDSTAIAVGANGTILRTEDKGRKWTVVFASIPLSTFRLSGVRHLTRERVVLAGYGGLLLWSTDAGLSWYPQESNTQKNLEALSFIDSKNGVAAGWDGTIMRTTTGGTLAVTRLAGSLPASVRVQESWPNPIAHNGLAHVRIELPHSGTARLRVYDLLGRERKTILSDAMDAGSYTVSWDASLPKGVYLYRLEQNGLSQVRKFTVVD